MPISPDEYTLYLQTKQPQPQTPWGALGRVLRLGSGAWFVHSGGAWRLSVCYLVFHALSVVPHVYACGTPVPPTSHELLYHYQALPDVYWALDACAPALFELYQYGQCRALPSFLTSVDDLYCHLCTHFPAYVKTHNASVAFQIQCRQNRDPAADISFLTAQLIVRRPGSQPQFLNLPGA